MSLVAAPPPQPAAKPVSLFDGQSLSGWEGNPKLWRVEGGALTGGSLTETVKQNEFLATTRNFTNSIVRMKIKLTGSEGFINSGFQIRSQRVPNSSEMSGYQCDYGDPNWWGAIYDESRRDKVLSPSNMEALGPVLKRGDWNEYVIRADGPRITTWLNGVQGTDYTEPDSSIPDFGKLGVQIHGGGKALVQVKDISVEELPVPAPGKKFVGAPDPSKPAKASPLTGEEERTTFTLAPGFEIELVAQESEGIGKFVTVDWDLRGRMWSMTALEYPVDANENPEVARALYASAAKDKVVVWDTPFAKGPHSPRVFADGLAIPLGILPYRNGVYVQHGPDIAFLSDTDGDGKADKREVMLSGFGVQDSHLFPHQFTRAPGNWIWFAQGAFNYGKVQTSKGAEQQFDRTRMARFRYDGSDFDITSQGPCNIWGFVLNEEGEAFIQEANDYGYPLMPFHPYANYPGCSDALFKSYAPEFPGTAPDFRMGGTGLSGLALSDKRAWPEAYADVFYLANPITRKIQAIRVHREGPRYRLEKLPDFVQSSDEMFRPVSIHFGPDGCLYIVDWYNKIISHNEVPRNHPERDKKRGRIWRVKHREQKPFAVPNFLTLTPEDLLAKLGGESLVQSHFAWQAIGDRELVELAPRLRGSILDPAQTAAIRIASLWALEGLRRADVETLRPLLRESNRNLRREAVRAIGEGTSSISQVVTLLKSLAEDADPEVRAEVIRALGNRRPGPANLSPDAIALLVRMGKVSLPGPTGKSTQSGKTIKVGEAYERDFERYLIRLFLEHSPQGVAAFLDDAASESLPLESRLLAALALDPKDSASRIAPLVATLPRAPNDEEILRLAEFADSPGIEKVLKTIFGRLEFQKPAFESLLRIRNRLDPAKLSALLTELVRPLWLADKEGRNLALRLISGFKLLALEKEINAALVTDQPHLASDELVSALRALRELGTQNLDGAIKYIADPDRAVAQEAVLTLASSRNAKTPSLLLTELWKNLSDEQRRAALGQLTSTRPGAQAVVKAIQSGDVSPDSLDGAILDKLQAVLPGDPELAAVLQKVGGLFRPVLRLDGKDDAWVESEITLDGPFTVETWIKLDPGIGNEDGILGAPGVLDMNFYDARFRVWVGGGINDAIIAKKPVTADNWTHVAVTRDGDRKLRIYQNGELDTADGKPVPGKFEKLRVGWSGANAGTAGWLTEYRVWNRARTEEEIRGEFDRSYEDLMPTPSAQAGNAQAQPDQGNALPPGLIWYFPGRGPWGKLHGSARIDRIADFPALLTSAEARAQSEKFARYRVLADKKGDSAHGKQIAAAVCLVCHTIEGAGGQIGPNLSGAGAMTLEGLLRSVLTPNAAMEAGYRVFRVELQNDEVLDGFFVSQDDEALVVRIPNSEDRRILRKTVRRSGFIRRSIMPEGLLEAMTEKDATDLLTYLRGLK